MGYSATSKQLDAAQWSYDSEMTIKQIENEPQTLFVSFESFQQGQTITFDQMVFPSYGLITAAATFSTHAGHAFKAAYDYIYYDDFRVNIPEGL